jgi:cold shock CspA family protein
MREIGKVVWFDDKLGAGLIKMANGSCLYVHYKDIAQSGHRELFVGERVSFLLESEGPELRPRDVAAHGHFRPWKYLREGFLTKLIKLLHRRRCVRYMWVVRDNRPTVNMVRYYILKTPFFEVYLHQFIDDDEEALHDHPWTFVTLIISGGYTEELAGGASRSLRPGRVVFRNASRLHRVVVSNKYRGRVWTLVVTGRRFHKWSFVDRDTGRYHTPYEYGAKRGAELRINADFKIRNGFFPRLTHGTRTPKLEIKGV